MIMDHDERRDGLAPSSAIRGFPAECLRRALCPTCWRGEDARRLFVRAEGIAGRGIECYWQLANGDLHAWQAKFFLDIPKETQWKQIDESVRSEEHTSELQSPMY